MVIIYKIVLIILIGAITVLLIAELLSAFSKLSFSKTSSKEGELKQKPSIIKSAFEILKADHQSKQSKKIKLFVAVLAFFVFQVIFGKVIFSIAFGAAVFVLIGKYFQSLINKKNDLFENQLTDALGLITNSVRSGQSLMQALENMVKEVKAPLADEFNLALSQVKLGTPVTEALIEMTKRVKSNDLRITVISINLAKETGGNLGDILTQLANTMRERKKLQGKVKATTAQGRASGMVVGSVPFLLLFVLYFMEPSMFGLMFSNIFGNIMLVFVFLMVSLGMYFINKIVTIDI